jgi:simple sugar transport system substrate-binding protein
MGEEKKVNRRDYLKYTGAAIGGLVVGGALGYLAKPAEVVEKTATVTIPGVEKTVTVTAPGTTITKITTQTTIPSRQFEGMKVIFVSGSASDRYSVIMRRGAEDAGKALGINVEVVFTEWDPKRMVQEVEAAIGRHPDGIICMGHPGYEGYREVFKKAYEEGIKIVMTDTDVPKLREEFPGVGYVGFDAYQLGVIRANVILRLGVKPGDRAAIFSGSWNEPERAKHPLGTYDTLVKAGLIVDKVEHPSSVYADPSTGVPYVVGYLSAHPDVKVISFDGTATTGAVKMYLEAAGVKPGSIIVAGSSVTPGSVEAMKAGYLTFVVDFPPYPEGYFTVQHLALSKYYRLFSSRGLFIDLGCDPIFAKDLEWFLKPEFDSIRY